jgi:hypothetical protein
VTDLIREAIFRPDYLIGSSGRPSLDICPLGELMDMYYAYESTKRHDKVYALLGMITGLSRSQQYLSKMETLSAFFKEL